MREAEARRVVERLLADDEWPDDDDFSQRARESIEDLSVVAQPEGEWAARVLFVQGAYRLGWVTTRLETLTEGLPCSPDVFASEARLYGITEPHGPAWGEADATGRHWLYE